MAWNARVLTMPIWIFHSVDDATVSVFQTDDKETLPNIRIMIMEPFLLKTASTEGNWDVFRREVEDRAAAAKRVAEKNGLIFVSLMKVLDDAQELAPAGYWIPDGVHPYATGQELIKREWLKAFKEMEM